MERERESFQRFVQAACTCSVRIKEDRECVCEREREREETLALKATNASPHQSVYFVGDQRDASVSEFTRRRSKRRLARMRRD